MGNLYWWPDNIMLTKEQKKIIKKHKERMYHMRVFGLDWQGIHQKRWDEDSLCWEDKCDCEKVKEV